jgi:hypothetical protein
MAAIGSTQTGFADLGAISAPGKLSYPTSAFLDDKGDGWVIGLHEIYARSNKYGPEYETTGAWVAFRPVGSGFHTPIELPTAGAQVHSALVAGNRTGRVLFAWSTELGTYLAWGAPAGSISTPTFIGRHFQASSLGVDEKGRALIVGYYPSKRYEDVAIAAVTAGASGSFSRPHVLAAQTRKARKRLIDYFGLPIVAIGARGNAIIAWETTWTNQRTEYEYPGPNLLLYRQANGHFIKPVRLAKGFLDPSVAATIDGAGGGIIVAATLDHGLQEVTVSPGGRITHQRSLWGFVDEVSLAGNAGGQTLVAWEDGLSAINVIVGNTKEIGATRQAFAASHYEIIATIDARGDATVIWLAEESSHERVIYARAIAPGAQTIKIASSVAPIPYGASAPAS